MPSKAVGALFAFACNVFSAYAGGGNEIKEGGSSPRATRLEFGV
jgi:hypothetical protein